MTKSKAGLQAGKTSGIVCGDDYSDVWIDDPDDGGSNFQIGFDLLGNFFLFVGNTGFALPLDGKVFEGVFELRHAVVGETFHVLQPQLFQRRKLLEMLDAGVRHFGVIQPQDL